MKRYLSFEDEEQIESLIKTFVKKISSKITTSEQLSEEVEEFICSVELHFLVRNEYQFSRSELILIEEMVLEELENYPN